MQKRLVADRVAGVIFVGLGVVSLSEGWRLYAMGHEASGMRPSLFSWFVMVGLGGILALFPKPQEKPVSWPKGRQAVVMAEGAALLVLYYLILPYLGFPISTFLASAGLFATIGGFRWHGCLLFSAVLTSVFYAMFVFWLQMPFPLGVFGV